MTLQQKRCPLTGAFLAVFFDGVFNKNWSLQRMTEFLSDLLSYFLSIDISSFNPRIVPKTKALGEQKIDNLEPLDKWIYTILKNGEFSTNTGWIARDKRNSIQEHAVSWLEIVKKVFIVYTIAYMICYM